MLNDVAQAAKALKQFGRFARHAGFSPTVRPRKLFASLDALESPFTPLYGVELARTPKAPVFVENRRHADKVRCYRLYPAYTHAVRRANMLEF